MALKPPGAQPLTDSQCSIGLPEPETLRDRCQQHVPVDEVSFSVNELHQLTSEAAVKLFGPELNMQQHIQALPCSQALQLQPPVQTPQLPSPAATQASTLLQ